MLKRDLLSVQAVSPVQYSILHVRQILLNGVLPCLCMRHTKLQNADRGNY